MLKNCSTDLDADQRSADANRFRNRRNQPLIFIENRPFAYFVRPVFPSLHSTQQMLIKVNNAHHPQNVDLMFIYI